MLRSPAFKMTTYFTNVAGTTASRIKPMYYMDDFNWSGVGSLYEKQVLILNNVKNF